MAKIHHGKSMEDEIPLLPVHEFLLSFMRKYGNRPFVTNATTKRSCTVAEFQTNYQRLADGLRCMGGRKGDVISCYGYNSVEYVHIVMAALSIGMTINTINPAATAYEMRHYLKQVQCKFIFTEDTLLENVESAIDVVIEKPEIILRQDILGYTSFNKICAKTYDVTGYHTEKIDVKKDVAYILFSSGTTGLPKGVMLTHYNVVSYVVIRVANDSFPADVTSAMAIFPMYHAGGMFGCVLNLAVCGITVIVMEKYNLELLLRSIHEYKPGAMLLPPTVMVQLTKTPLLDQYDVSSVKLCRTGGAPVRTETEEAFKRRFNNIPISNGYGMTESVAGVIYKAATSAEDQKKQGSSGKPRSGTSLKVIDPNTGEILEPFQRGEVCIFGPQVMKGYLNNQKATMETVDKDHWLHTGDIGYYDEDGYFYIVDRLKELIKYKGNQVAPAELESVLLEHAEVADAGVIGVPDPDAGELPRAYVVKRQDSKVTEQQIADYVNERVSYYKKLRGGVVFIEEIPKLPSGKLLRRTLREMASSSDKKSKL